MSGRRKQKGVCLLHVLQNLLVGRAGMPGGGGGERRRQVGLDLEYTEEATALVWSGLGRALVAVVGDACQRNLGSQFSFFFWSSRYSTANIGDAGLHFTGGEQKHHPPIRTSSARTPINSSNPVSRNYWPWRNHPAGWTREPQKEPVPQRSPKGAPKCAPHLSRERACAGLARHSCCYRLSAATCGDFFFGALARRERDLQCNAFKTAVTGCPCQYAFFWFDFEIIMIFIEFICVFLFLCT